MNRELYTFRKKWQLHKIKFVNYKYVMRVGAKTCISALHGRITIIRKPQLISDHAVIKDPRGPFAYMRST